MIDHMMRSHSNNSQRSDSKRRKPKDISPARREMEISARLQKCSGGLMIHSQRVSNAMETNDGNTKTAAWLEIKY
jgi:hypothetical protein